MLGASLADEALLVKPSPPNPLVVQNDKRKARASRREGCGRRIVHKDDEGGVATITAT